MIRPLMACLMLRRQFERRDTPEGPPHDPQVTPETPSCQFIRHGLEQDIGIVNKIRQCWNPAAHSIPSVIGNHEVQLFLVVERGNLIVVTDHLPIAVKKQDPGPLRMTCVKTAPRTETSSSTGTGRSKAFSGHSVTSLRG